MIQVENEIVQDVNLPLLERFFIERGSSIGTQRHYRASVRLYEQINHMTLDELLTEAEAEEEDGIRWKNRKLKERLMNFRGYVYGNFLEKTANTYFGDIRTIYRHFEVELHKLPSLLSKQVNKSYEKDYDDLLTKDEIKDAYLIAPNVVKAIILFGISSGLSKSDILKLTVNDWISFCDEYITTKNLKDQLEELKDVKELIPCIKGERMKTTTKYVTFCSPEASEHILAHLLTRYYEIPLEYEDMKQKIKQEKDLDKKKALVKKFNKMPQQLERSHKLFDISYSHLNYTVRKINTQLDLGFVGKYTKFRMHQLRSFQASTLLNCKENAFTESEIDALQGRKKDMTHRAYLIESRDKLFKKYYDHVDELMLFKSIHTVDEEAYNELEKENRYYKKEIVKNEVKFEEQQKKIDEILKIQEELETLVKLHKNRE